MTITNFNIRVYGIVLNSSREILITHERYKNQILTKFVGGGLEKGEGLKDGLIREFEEELGESVELGDLIYVNDFFQQSAFVETDQIISVFYIVNPKNFDQFVKRTQIKNDNQNFEWIPLQTVKSDLFSFNIEKTVLTLLQQKY